MYCTLFKLTYFTKHIYKLILQNVHISLKTCKTGSCLRTAVFVCPVRYFPPSPENTAGT